MFSDPFSQVEYGSPIYSEKYQYKLFSYSPNEFELDSGQSIGLSNDFGINEQEAQFGSKGFLKKILESNIWESNIEPHESFIISTSPQPSNVLGQSLILIPCIARTDEAKKDANININAINNQRPELPFHRRRKRKVDLSEDELEFKYNLYKFFTKKKKFSKKYVIKIHNIMMKKLNFPSVTRDETRQIDLYFKHYAYAKKEIFDFIKENKEQIKSEVFDS